MISVIGLTGGPSTPPDWPRHSALPRKYVDANFASLDPESFYAGASPPPVSGDVFCNASTSSPGGYNVTMLASGLEVIDAGGDTSRQSFAIDFYDYDLKKWTGQATAYVNNQAPVFSPAELSKALTIDVAMAADDLKARASDFEGDTLTWSSSITGTGTGVNKIPVGTAVDANGNWTGTPTALGSGSFTGTVTDVPGDTDTLTVDWTVSAVAVTYTVRRPRLGGIMVFG